MKTLIPIFIALVITTSCKKSDPAPKTEPGPDPIHRSALYKTEGKLITATLMTATWNKSSNVLTVSIKRSNTTTTDDLAFDVKAPAVSSFIVKGDADISNPDYAAGSYVYTTPTNSLVYGSKECNPNDSPGLSGYVDGLIKITELDETKKIVTGEFSFDACGNGIVNKIREGKFTNIELTIVQ